MASISEQCQMCQTPSLRPPPSSPLCYLSRRPSWNRATVRCWQLPFPPKLSPHSLAGSLSYTLACSDASWCWIPWKQPRSLGKLGRHNYLYFSDKKKKQISAFPGMVAFALNKQLKVGTRQRGMKVKPTERKPVSALPAFITVYPDPACRREFALHVIAVMSTRVFSNLIMKCHQQEQTAGKNKLCNNSPHECCNSCSSCVFRVFVSDTWAPSCSN